MKGLFVTGSPAETPGSPGRAGSKSEPKAQVLYDSGAHRHNPVHPPASPGIPPELVAGREPPAASPARPTPNGGPAALYQQPTSAARAEPVGGQTALTDPQLASQPGSPGGRGVWREGETRARPRETVAFV